MIKRRQFLFRLTAFASVTGLAGATGLRTGARAQSAALRLIGAAREQIGVTVGYDGSYQSLGYPGGDVARRTGVCTDVIIRAYRDGLGVDLQESIHEDMRENFQSYPGIWGLAGPDRNIDHRRVPNLETWFNRHGYEKPAQNWQAGDIVSMRLGRNLPHIGLVCAKTGRDGMPLIIHNIGRGTREESLLGVHINERRFRFLPG